MDLSCCPICNVAVPVSQLERHANSHFEDDEQIVEDMILAQQIALLPATPPEKMINHLKAEKSFQFRSREVASCSSGNKEMGDDDETAVGLLVSLQTKCSFHKIEDGVITLLKNCLELEPGDSTSILSGYVDHFPCIDSEDSGWGCGWRNIQILTSNLLKERQEARDVLFGGSGFVPDILSLQRWLEIAWQKGFDLEGSAHFGHKIYGSKSWIGATECAALLRSFGLRVRVVDFGPKKLESLFLSVPGSRRGSSRGHNRGKRNLMGVYGPMDEYIVRKKSYSEESSSNSTDNLEANLEYKNGEDLSSNFTTTSKGQQVLVDWVWNYFRDGNVVKLGTRSVSVSKKPPLFFQHDGHSRTIIGIQAKHQSKGMQQYNLLVLDPGHKTGALEGTLKRNSGWQRFIKRGVHTLKKPQYQLCYVDPGIGVGEELEQLKTIDSVYVDF